MLVGGVDFETTGIDPEKCFVTEIGAALFNPDTWEITETFSCFVHEPKALPLPPEITKLTGITDEMVFNLGIEPKLAFTRLKAFLEKAKFVIAHNAPFDEGFYYMECARAGIPVPQTMWYCSNTDVPHVDKFCRKLSHLAFDYGAQVDISKLHRALDDVKLMGQMLKGSGFTFDQIKAYADEPWVYLKAKVSYEDKDLAKAEGFGWEKCHGTYNPLFPKTWVKRIKASKLEEERTKDVKFKREVISAVSRAR